MTDRFFLRWSNATPEEVAPGVRVLEKHGDSVEVGKIFLSPGTELKMHAHPEEQMFYLLSGRLRYRIGDIEDVAGPGDLIVMPSGLPHWGRVESDEGAVFIEIKERRRAKHGP
jgi:quercetin dioxygenase-like cupin family protein